MKNFKNPQRGHISARKPKIKNLKALSLGAIMCKWPYLGQTAKHKKVKTLYFLEVQEKLS